MQGAPVSFKDLFAQRFGAFVDCYRVDPSLRSISSTTTYQWGSRNGQTNPLRPKPIEALRKSGHECVPSLSQCGYHEAQAPHSACHTQENTRSVHNRISVASTLLTLISRNQAHVTLSLPPPPLPSTTCPKPTLSLFHRSPFHFTCPVTSTLSVPHMLSHLNDSIGKVRHPSGFSLAIRSVFFSALRSSRPFASV